MNRIQLTTIAVVCLTLTSFAQAQDVIEDDLKATVSTAAAESQDGWKLGLTLGATISFQHNSKVVGSVDGANFQLGLVMDGFANFRSGDHEWQNSLGIRETFTKTPNVDLFLKSTDSLALKTTYLYRIPDVDWLGPFVRVSLDTSIFEGYDARPTDTTVIRTKTTGDTATEVVAAQESIDLTGYFEPLTLKEVAGLFANPVQEKEIQVNIQLGVGGTQTFTQNGYVLSDKADTPELELVQIEDFQQAGGELEIGIKGQVEEYMTWGTNASFFQPFYSSIDNGLSGLDLMTIKFNAGVSVRLAKWASLDYVLTAKREPLILDEWQVQNGLLLTAGFSIFSDEPKTP